MIQLPIDDHIKRIQQTIKAHDSMVVVSPPGSGKTTRIPPAIVNSLGGLVVLLQPRRVAVRNSVTRIAAEQGWSVGEQVGYQIRFEKKWSQENTKLLVVTEGVLSKWIQRDPELNGISCVILDEFHERSLHSDFALAWIKTRQDQARERGAGKSPKLIVMSATMNGQELSVYLGGAPLIESEGKLFPLEIHHLKKSINYHGRKELTQRLVDQLSMAVKKTSGTKSILVFLPGVGEIEAAQKELNESDISLPVFSLHGRQSSEEQDRALVAGPGARIILATNVAETSLTVEGVSVVVDSGLERVMSYDPSSGVESLNLQRISQASADQRAGRAARLENGICYRMWTIADGNKMAKFLPPEICRIDIAEWILFVKNMGQRDVRCFPWLTQPGESHIEDGERCLRLLGFVDDSDNINSDGRMVVGWPMGPRISRILIESCHINEVKGGSILAAILTEKEFLLRIPSGEEFDKGADDLSFRVDVFRNRKNWSRNELNQRVIRSIEQVQRQYFQLLERVGITEKLEGLKIQNKVAYLVFRGFPDRLSRRREKNKHKAKMFGGRGVLLSKESCLKKGDLFTSVNPMNLRGISKTESQVSWASPVEKYWVEKVYPQYVKEHSWIEERKGVRPMAFKATQFFDIPIEKPRGVPISAEMKKEMKLSRWAQSKEDLVTDFPAVGIWEQRVHFLSNYLPEYEWPAIDHEDMIQALGLALEIVEDIDEFTEESALEAVEVLLSPMQASLLEKEAPERYKLTSGRTRPVEYGENQIPKISIKIQELFGVNTHPSLAQGKCSLRLELLAPNFKAVQMTSDLVQFWKTSYLEVRKELRIRYSKHAWPEDPISAHPEFKGSYPKK